MESYISSFTPTFKLTTVSPSERSSTPSQKSTLNQDLDSTLPSNKEDFQRVIDSQNTPRGLATGQPSDSHRHRCYGYDGQHDAVERSGGSEERQQSQHWHRRLFVDTSDHDSDKSKSFHRHSKSRDALLPRTMNQLASSASRGFLPGKYSGKEKDQEKLDILQTQNGIHDIILPRPGLTRNSTSSGQGSQTRGLTVSGRSSLMKRKEIGTMEDLDRERQRREKVEQHLRSTLSSIGALAADLSRRLDFSYYNLLDKISALHATVDSFQELTDSSTHLLNEFQREAASTDAETCKQLEEFAAFQSQIQKITTLEKRLGAGRRRVEELGRRLETVKGEIDDWERREMEWQARMSKRLRIMWTIMGTIIVALIVAAVVQSWTPLEPPSGAGSHLHKPIMNRPLYPETHKAGISNVSSAVRNRETRQNECSRPPPYPEVANHATGSMFSPTTTWEKRGTQSKNEDPLRVFDEL